MQPSTPTPVSIGIDVGKYRLDAACLFDNGETTHTGVPNDPSGITRLITWIDTHGAAQAVPWVIESTGDYHLPVGLMATQAGYRVHCINPLTTKKYQKSAVRGNKTDRVDAARLAEIGRLEPHLPVFTATPEEISGRKLLASKQKLIQIRQPLRRHLAQLKETCEKLGLSLGELDASLEELCGHIDRVIERIDAMLTEQSDATARTLAEGVRGLSPVMSATLCHFFAGTSFTTADQMVAYTGLDVCRRESGTWRGKEKLSKRGNPFIRLTLFQTAWGLSMNHPYYQEMYRERRARGRSHREALTIIARSFLRSFFCFYVRGQWRFSG